MTDKEVLKACPRACGACNGFGTGYEQRPLQWSGWDPNNFPTFGDGSGASNPYDPYNKPPKVNATIVMHNGGSSNAILDAISGISR